MVSSPRAWEVLPFLVPNVGQWDSCTPSPLSFQLDSSSDQTHQHSATFLIDSLVMSLCVDNKVHQRRKLRPPLSPDTSPPPTPIRMLQPATCQEGWLECEEELHSINAFSDQYISESAAPTLRQQATYIGTPKYRLCHMTVENLCDKNENVFVNKVYHKGTFCTINARSLKGRPLRLSKEDNTQVELHISALLTVDLVCVSKRTAFLSFPFVVPKASGESHLIVNFSHLRGKYLKLNLKMPVFLVVLRCWHPIKKSHLF